MTTKLHDLAPLRAEIKRLAQTSHDLRAEARETSGMDRWSLKAEANDHGTDARYLLLAYGYLRGLSISRMESPHTRNTANQHRILAAAKPHFRKLVEESEEEREAAWKDFTAHVAADLQAWNSECALRRIERTMKRRQSEVA